MRVYSKNGSKERLVEMFQNVNKIKLSEDFGVEPQSTYDLVNNVLNGLKNGEINTQKTNTVTSDGENLVQLICTDANENQINLTFTVNLTSGEQDNNIFNINNVELTKFNFNPSDESQPFNANGNDLARANSEHAEEFIDLVKDYVVTNTNQSSESIEESTDQDRYEDVVFMQDEEAEEPLNILNTQGEDAAMEYLKQWHNPGQHMGRNNLGHGSNDEIYEKDGYIMSWNSRIGYIGLQYDLSKMIEESIPNTGFNTFDGGSNPLQTAKAYVDEKPTNSSIRVNAPELNKYVDENETTEIKPQISGSKKEKILNAYDTLVNSGIYAPTMDQVMAELNKNNPRKAVGFNRVWPKEAEPYLEENIKDKNFKFHEGDKITFLSNKEGGEIEGIISDYDYHMMTWKPSYSIDYIKDGKTWTAIGVPEDKITLITPASNDEYLKKFNQNKMIRQMNGELPLHEMNNVNVPIDVSNLTNNQYKGLSWHEKYELIKLATQELEDSMGIDIYQISKDKIYELIKEKAKEIFIAKMTDMNEVSSIMDNTVPEDKQERILRAHSNIIAQKGSNYKPTTKDIRDELNKNNNVEENAFANDDEVASSLLGYKPENDIEESTYINPEYKPTSPLNLKPGSRVKVNQGSGLDSDKEGIVIPPNMVKTDSRGIPINVNGAYKPVDWKREVAIKLDDGEIITMFKNRLINI